MNPRKNRQHTPDVLTDRKRKEQFSPTRPGFMSREKMLDDILNRQKATQFKIYRDVMRGLPKVQGIWQRRGKSPEEALTAQALLLSRLACDYADHGLKGLRMKGVINDEKALKNMGIDLKDPNKDKKAWDYYYNGMIDMFSEDKRIPNRGEVHDRMVEIDRFSGMSEKLHDLRKKHWEILHKIAKKIMMQGQDPEKNLTSEVGWVLKRPRTDYQRDAKSTVVESRARDICLAVSVYADVMEMTNKKEWPTAYTEGMLAIYPLLKDKPELIHAIAEIE